MCMKKSISNAVIVSVAQVVIVTTAHAKNNDHLSAYFADLNAINHGQLMGSDLPISDNKNNVFTESDGERYGYASCYSEIYNRCHSAHSDCGRGHW